MLDLGCGAGLDSLIAARRVGATGHVIGIDFSGSMLARARQAATAYGTGVFNLNSARGEIFRELARVVRPGGCVFASELVLREAVAKPTEFTEAEWFA